MAVALMFGLSAQAQNDTDANAGFDDGIDRMAEDFVVASVCIADQVDWQDDFLGILGHSFIRLQCKTFDLDVCYSYESENMNDEFSRFLNGGLKMGMFAIPTDEYISDYKKWNRAVHEYTLNLPPEAETRLWQIMDRQVEMGAEQDFDLMKRGCTQTIVWFVKGALASTPIVYGEWPERFGQTRRQLVNEEMATYPWLMLFGSDMLVGQGFSADCDNEEKIVIPTQLPEVWTKATVNGKPLLTYKGDLVEAAPVVAEPPLVTPILLAFIILALVVLLAFTSIRYVDWAVLGVQFVIGLLCCWLQFMSALQGDLALWLLPLYNPLPLLLWKKRGTWAVLYACLLALWIITVTLKDDVYVDNAHLVFALSVIVVLMREPVVRFIAKKKKN